MCKKKYKLVGVIAVTLVCVIMDGCGKEEKVSIPTIEAEDLNPEREDVLSNQSEDVVQDSKEMGKEPQSEAYEPCNVSFTSTCVETPLRKNVFAVGGSQVWMCGSRTETGDVGNLKDNTYFVGNLEAPITQEDSWLMKNVGIDIPEDMRVFRMTVDGMGNAHMLWRSRGEKVLDGQEFPMDIFTDEKYLLMVVKPDGTVLKESDITEFMAKYESLALCFTVDDSGNYYKDQGKKILQFTAEGEILQEISCEGEVVSIAQGKTGTMYCVLNQQDSVERLYRIESDGTMTQLGEVPDRAAMYPDMGAGTDTELILFRMDGGIHAVEVDGNVATFTLRVPESDMPVSGQEIGGRGILGDGRVCLFQYKEDGCLLHYIAVGR